MAEPSLGLSPARAYPHALIFTTASTIALWSVGRSSEAHYHLRTVKSVADIVATMSTRNKLKKLFHRGEHDEKTQSSYSVASNSSSPTQPTRYEGTSPGQSPRIGQRPLSGTGKSRFLAMKTNLLIMLFPIFSIAKSSCCKGAPVTGQEINGQQVSQSHVG